MIDVVPGKDVNISEYITMNIKCVKSKGKDLLQSSPLGFKSP